MDFIKKFWKSKEIVRASDVNRWEEGIEEAITKTQSLNEDVTDFLNSITVQDQTWEVE